jgi:hypothetical protein
MAQMPRGEPRSVPDPAGDQYDAMIQQERVKRQRAEAAASKLSSYQYAAPFSPDYRLEALSKAPIEPNPITTVGGRSFREIDNGYANVLVPIDDPLASPAELEGRRRTVALVQDLASHPFGSLAYDLATLANASPRTRDRALAAGGIADEAMLAIAPGMASVRGPAARPQGQLASPTVRRPSSRLGALNAAGQATRADVTLTAPMLGTGTKANRRLTPPGWSGNGRIHNEARAHLWAKSLGGTGDDMRNIVTMTHRGANTPQMSKFENSVSRRVRGGEVIEYSATPLYCSGVLPPSATLLTALGTRGPPAARLILNPAGRRK